jgi:NADPH:quinone reductase-like Zn-dependent oxidoreductase
MKAVRYHSYGDSGVLVYEEAERPVASAGQVVLKVAGLAADGGAFVSTTFPDLYDAGRGVRVVSVSARSDAAQLAELVARADAGDLKIDVGQRRPLTDLAAIHDQAVAGRLPGKTVLIP